MGLPIAWSPGVESESTEVRRLQPPGFPSLTGAISWVLRTDWHFVHYDICLSSCSVTCRLAWTTSLICTGASSPTHLAVKVPKRVRLEILHRLQPP